MNKKLIFFFSLLAIFFILPIFLSLIWQKIYLPKDFYSTQNKEFEIKKGQNIFQIANALSKENLIKNKYFFVIYAILKGKHKKIQAGTYQLNAKMNIPEILEKFTKGETLKIKITFSEGLTLQEIEERLKIFFPKIDLKKFKVKDFQKDFDFLKKVPPQVSLEGFLFPDTYFFDKRMSDREIVKTFLKNFNKKLNSHLREEIKKQGKSIFEVVILASLIEKEVYNTPDCQNCKNLVAGILWKRLKNKIPLQVDATLFYICQQCKKNLTFKEAIKEAGKLKKIDSSYNTYKYLGLPPTPICNPGLESIKSAIFPEKSNYWYYLSTPDGKTIFSKTLKEHNLAKKKYLK